MGFILFLRQTLVLIWIILLLANVVEGSQELYLLYDKAKYRLYLKRGEEVLMDFPAGHGLKSLLPKSKRGDFLTPEGIYKITEIRLSAQYYYFIELSYPNWNDLSWAYYRGEIDFARLKRAEGKTLGNAIGIHGGGSFKKEKGGLNYNWTQGCVALNNPDLERLIPFLRPGQRVYLVDSEKGLFEFLKKLAYPLKVKPLDFWEGALYFRIDEATYWYFYLKESAKGERILLWEEWHKGRLAQQLKSQGEGKFEVEKEERLKGVILQRIFAHMEPLEFIDLETWK